MESPRTLTTVLLPADGDPGPGQRPARAGYAGTMTKPRSARLAFVLGLLAGPLPLLLALAGFAGIRTGVPNAGNVVLLAGALAFALCVPAIVAGRIAIAASAEGSEGRREARLGTAFGVLGVVLVIGTVVWLMLAVAAIARAL